MATTTNNEKPQGYEHTDLVDEKHKHHVGNQMLGDVEQTLINDPEYRAKEKQLVQRLDMTLMPMVVSMPATLSRSQDYYQTNISQISPVNVFTDS